MINKLRKLVDSFFLTRPIVQIPVWTIVILGALTASPQKILQIPGLSLEFWIGLACFNLIVAHIYIVNQIIDRESDRINHKLFILPENHLSVEYAWVLAIFTATLGLLGAFLFCSSALFLILLISITLGLLYNLTPFALKDRPWGGVVANLLGHGMISYFLGWYIVAQPKSLHEIGLGVLFSLSAGFANAAVYLTSTIPDVTGDSAVGKKTFAVEYGAKRCSFVASLSVTFSLVFAFLIPFNSWIMIIPALLSTGIFWRYYYNPVDSVAITFRWPVAILGVAIGLYIPLYLAAVIVIILLSRFYYSKRFALNYPAIK